MHLESLEWTLSASWFLNLCWMEEPAEVVFELLALLFYEVGLLDALFRSDVYSWQMRAAEQSSYIPSTTSDVSRECEQLKRSYSVQ